MSDIILTSAETKEKVFALRNNPNAKLIALRDKYNNMLNGKSCLVVGSAPRAIIPSKDDYSMCICVNGSPFVANRYSIPINLTVLVGFVTAMKKEIFALSMDKLRNIHSEEVLFISVGDTETNCLENLNNKNFTFNGFSEITPIERAVIVGEVCGVELGL